jgi:predicted permease
VLLFTLAVSIVTGILFGLVPAMQTLKIRVSPVLKEATRAIPGSASRFGWGKGLITGQVALSLLVLFAASLLVGSLRKLMSQDFGYDHDHLVIARLDPAAAGYKKETMKLLAQQLTTRLASTPGVRAVSYSSNGLFAGSESGDAVLVPGFEATSPRNRGALEDYVGPDYFRAVGIPIISGRGIEAQDTATSRRVAVINEAMVRRFFSGQAPLGHEFRIDDRDWRDKPLTIVGVSRDAKDHGSGLREDVQPRFYQAFQQTPDPSQIMLEARVNGEPTAAVTNIVGQIKVVDPDLPISFVRTLNQRIAESAANQIALAKLSGFFAGLALLLACVGLYGIMSYTVAGRTREIAVRMALGARRTDVTELVLREGMSLVVIGLVIGIPLALVSSRLLQSLLFGLSSTDPSSLFAVVSLLGIVAALAGFIPARRASRIDPMTALRYE